MSIESFYLESIRDCNNNPINFVDPTGHMTYSIDGVTYDTDAGNQAILDAAASFDMSTLGQGETIDRSGSFYNSPEDFINSSEANGKDFEAKTGYNPNAMDTSSLYTDDGLDMSMPDHMKSDHTPGYTDMNITINPGVVGVTTGSIKDNTGEHHYIGISIGTPGGSFSFSHSRDTMAPCVNLGVQGTYFVPTGQASYGFGESTHPGGSSKEAGLGLGYGASFVGYYVF